MLLLVAFFSSLLLLLGNNSGDNSDVTNKCMFLPGSWRHLGLTFEKYSNRISSLTGSRQRTLAGEGTQGPVYLGLIPQRRWATGFWPPHWPGRPRTASWSEEIPGVYASNLCASTYGGCAYIRGFQHTFKMTCDPKKVKNHWHWAS